MTKYIVVLLGQAKHFSNNDKKYYPKICVISPLSGDFLPILVGLLFLKKNVYCWWRYNYYFLLQTAVISVLIYIWHPYLCITTLWSLTLITQFLYLFLSSWCCFLWVADLKLTAVLPYLILFLEFSSLTIFNIITH